MALFDDDPALVGERVVGVEIRPLAELDASHEVDPISIGVIATPAPAAQSVCDRLVGAGISSILNFAPAVLSVPRGVDVRRVDLSTELQILAFHAQRKALAAGRLGTAVVS